MPPTKSNSLSSSAQAQQEAISDAIESFELPKSLVTKIARSGLGENAKLQKEAMLSIVKGSTVFINYLAATAHDVAISKQHKSVSASDILKALDYMGMGDMTESLQRELQIYREIQKADKPKKGSRGKAKESESTSAAQTAAKSKGKGKEKEKASAGAQQSASATAVLGNAGAMAQRARQAEQEAAEDGVRAREKRQRDADSDAQSEGPDGEGEDEDENEDEDEEMLDAEEDDAEDGMDDEADEGDVLDLDDAEDQPEVEEDGDLSS